MNATQKNTMVMIAFFVLIMWMAVYYSTVLQQKLQSPVSYFDTEQQANTGSALTLN